MATMHKIAICMDKIGKWHEKFIDAMKSLRSENLSYQLVDIDHHDWISEINKFDAVIYKSSYMGAKSSGYYKEKIFFIENYLKKIVIPNYKTVWHFESKIAQSYLFKHFEIRTPETVVSFDYHDALNTIANMEMPVVMKKSDGAGSSNVFLVRTQKSASKIIANAFCDQLWNERKSSSDRALKVSLVLKQWFWKKMLNYLTDKDRFHAIYWQSFVRNNNSDLRITVIGNRYAFAFWRKNRKNDFRASGSGNLDYGTNIPENVLRYCIEFNEKMGFDSMAYDILFTDDSFLVVEMSYGYSDSAIYNSPGYYEIVNKQLIFHSGHFWPQFLWVEWLMQRINQAKKKNDDQVKETLL